MIDIPLTFSGIIALIVVALTIGLPTLLKKYLWNPKLHAMKDRGGMIEWIVVLGTIFACAIAYIVFTPVMAQIKQLANDTGVNVSAGTTGGNVFATFEYWPMLVIVGMIIWALALSRKTEEDSSRYY